ncbi:phosphopentomutase [Vibrio comitans]|uniref:Phosphopentomutase n=1 Tax=Vibrio comitans NBRC 102076 TaxID=1219078 RepID=A0A4Y3INC0_9VIBR|nr:phosphopentomutase [Vibrio comitans]GEA60595.1 phosphopentomutase [Vibrio comitans NBRC 102076]
MSRFIVFVLDGFGIGEMQDVASERPQDIGSNTALKLLSAFSDKRLPTLEMLGLNNVVNCDESVMRPSSTASVGKCNLKHEGCDTFAGHQEIMGSKPRKPLVKPFFLSIDNIERALQFDGYSTQRITQGGRSLLLINGCVAVGDNLEAELGQVYNVTANLSEISFDEVQKIGEVIRSNNDVSRNVVFGGLLASNQNLIDAIEVHGECIGVNAPRTGVYDKGFKVIHLGYGVDYSIQVPEMLNERGINTVLVGKVADIVHNPHGISRKRLSDTIDICRISVEELSKSDIGFFCINVQETDLAGHKQDPEAYWSTLDKADRGLEEILKIMNKNDILIVTADHGNDPYIGHGKHTREYTPLLVYGEQIECSVIGERLTLADIGATACDYFGANAPQFGESFLPLLNRITK